MRAAQDKGAREQRERDANDVTWRSPQRKQSDTSWVADYFIARQKTDKERAKHAETEEAKAVEAARDKRDQEKDAKEKAAREREQALERQEKDVQEKEKAAQEAKKEEGEKATRDKGAREQRERDAKEKAAREAVAAEGAADPGIKKGSRCWYTDRDGRRREVEVLSVDASVRPASYGIRIDATSTRETEVPPHQPSHPTPPSPSKVAGSAEGGPPALWSFRSSRFFELPT